MPSAADNLAQYIRTLNVGGRNLGAFYGPSAVAPSTFDPKGKENPVFKGIDFTTGRTVDLGQYADTAENTSQSPESTYNFKPSETKPTEGFWDVILDPKAIEARRIASQLRREDSAYDAAMAQQMFQSYIPEMERLARSTRIMDYQLGLKADINSPTRQQQRAAVAQQQAATAAGAEAGLLSAVNDAAYKNAMANIAGLRSGMRRG